VKKLVLMVALAALLAGGCGGAGSGAANAPVSSVSHSIDPNFDTGQTVLLTANSPRPLWLVSLVGKPVIFRNSSSTTKRVVFDHAAIDSGPIPPGGTFTWRPTLPLSYTYQVGHVHARVQVSALEGASP
jgi:hypothetical protein